MGHQPRTESRTPALAVAGAARPTASAPAARTRAAAGRSETRDIRDMDVTLLTDAVRRYWQKGEVQAGRRGAVLRGWSALNDRRPRRSRGFAPDRGGSG